MDQISSGAVFQVSVPGVAQPQDVLGLWQPMSMDSKPGLDSLSFSTTPVGNPDATYWRVDLAGDRKQAQKFLEQSRNQVRLVDLDLNEAQKRLRRFSSAPVSAIQQSQISFAVTSASLAVPELELQQALELDLPAQSFAFGWSLPAEWQQTAQEAQDFLNQVRQMLAHYAYVESAASGNLIGRTAVTWLGDFDTLWRTGTNRDLANLHRRSLDITLHSRQAWLKMAMLIGQGAALLGLLTTTSNPLVIPAVYKFIKQVISQYREIRAVQSNPA